MKIYYSLFCVSLAAYLVHRSDAQRGGAGGGADGGFGGSIGFSVQGGAGGGAGAGGQGTGSYIVQSPQLRIIGAGIKSADHKGFIVKNENRAVIDKVNKAAECFGRRHRVPGGNGGAGGDGATTEAP